MDNSSVRNGVSAIVEYDYTAKEPDELHLTKGASIHNIKVQPGGWWEGTLTATGQIGMFPDNFVKVVDADAKNPVVLRQKSATASRRCKAVYSYTQNNNDELTLGVGDLIEFLGEVEEGWWRGQLGGKIGVFPSNFVTLEAELPALAADRRTAAATVASAAAASTTAKLVQHQQQGVAQAAVVAAEAAAIAKQMSNSREDLDTLVDAPVLPPKPVRELCKVIYPYTPANEDELELREGEIIMILSRELPDKGWLKGELRGKIGVFPDNFVLLVSSEASPVKDLTANSKPERPPPTTKLLINTKMSTSTSSHSSSASTTLSTTSASKESFGSRDSLNDTTAVIPTGNVAAYRKSLEKQVLDITTGPAAAAGAASTGAATGAQINDKNVRKTFDTKTADFRKSLENLDDKSKRAPPVSKKPEVLKKSPTVSSVVGSIFPSFKSKVVSSNIKTTTTNTTIESSKTASNDNLDGSGHSRVAYSVSENHVLGDRIRRENSADFDQVERGQSILQDMRAGRVKAPKRRPPTNSVSVTGSSSDSVSDALFSNGSANEGTNGDSTDPDQEAKAKAAGRNWEKQKAPWMDELRASQAKKTSPGVADFGGKSLDYDPASAGNATIFEKTTNASFDMSKSFSSSYVSSSTTSSSQSVRKSAEFNNFSTVESKVSPAPAVDVQMRSTTENQMTRSIAGGITANRLTFNTSSTTEQQATTHTNASEKKPRPTSVNLRNRSISPIGRMSTQSVHIASPPPATSTPVNNSANQTTTNAIDTQATSTKSLHVNHFVVADLPPSGAISGTINNHHLATTPLTIDNVCPRVQELEQKVGRLERLVQQQAQTIDDLMRTARDESDKVKTLRGELDKYAQCVTQV